MEPPSGQSRLIELEGQRPWGLPNHIGCPDCTIYVAVGPPYPDVDLERHLPAADLPKPSSASWRQFVEIRNKVRPAVPSAYPLPPGTTFGPLRGVLRGQWGDFAEADLGSLFIAQTAYDAMLRRGVRLPPTVRPHLRARKGATPDLVELAIVPAGELAPSGYRLKAPAPCATCGRWDRALEEVILRGSSVPPDQDIFRPVNQWTVVIVSERFVAAVKELELGGLVFQPVRIAEAAA